MDIDKICSAIADDFFIDCRNNPFYVGDIVMVAASNRPIFGIVKKLYKKVNNFTVIPYDVSKNLSYVNFKTKRFYPCQTVVVNNMFNSNSTENRKIIEQMNNEKRSEKLIYAYFKDRVNFAYGVCAFKVYSQCGKRFCKDDIERNMVDIVAKYQQDYELRFFTKDDKFIPVDDINNFNNVFTGKAISYGAMFTHKGFHNYLTDEVTDASFMYYLPSNPQFFNNYNIYNNSYMNNDDRFIYKNAIEWFDAKYGKNNHNAPYIYTTRTSTWNRDYRVFREFFNSQRG